MHVMREVLSTADVTPSTARSSFSARKVELNPWSATFSSKKVIFTFAAYFSGHRFHRRPHAGSSVFASS